jgi:glycosyltransferase involved in cell wall biosynthesis
LDLKKRVLFIDHDTERTGSSVSLEYIIKGFIERGYIVFVLTSKNKLNNQKLIDAGAQTVSYSSKKYFPLSLYTHFASRSFSISLLGFVIIVHDIIAFFWGIIIVAIAIKKTNPHLVYVNEHVFVQGSVAARLLKIPSVIHIRSRMLNPTSSVRKKILSRLLLRNNDLVITITEVERNQLEVKEEEKQKVKVIGEFFPYSSSSIILKSAKKSQYGVAENKRMVTMLGGIAEIKGTFVFLQAATHIHRNTSDVVFVIAGRTLQHSPKDKAHYDKCVPIIESLIKTHALIMLGEIEDPLALIAATDILVTPSTDTHFSRPAIEAWGLGKPVVASDTQHMQILISHGVDGLLFRSGDSDELAKCLTTLLSDQELCYKLGEAGRGKTFADYNAEKNLNTIIQYCDQLTKGSNV